MRAVNHKVPYYQSAIIYFITRRSHDFNDFIHQILLLAFLFYLTNFLIKKFIKNINLFYSSKKFTKNIRISFSPIMCSIINFIIFFGSFVVIYATLNEHFNSEDYQTYDKKEIEDITQMYIKYLSEKNSESFVRELSINAYNLNCRVFIEKIFLEDMIKSDNINELNLESNREFVEVYYQLLQNATEILNQLLYLKNYATTKWLIHKKFCLMYSFVDRWLKNKILLENKQWQEFIQKSFNVSQ